MGQRRVSGVSSHCANRVSFPTTCDVGPHCRSWHLTTAHACLDRITCLPPGIKLRMTLCCSKTSCAQDQQEQRPPVPYEPSSGMPNLLKCASTIRALVRQAGNQLRFSCSAPLLACTCPCCTTQVVIRLSCNSAYLFSLAKGFVTTLPTNLWAYFQDARMLLRTSIIRKWRHGEE